ncbi:Glycine cleavage system H protein, mitochondrial [Psilocybe cubensis]|uniref:Glycine cleavage system H protein, mitochondrial n=2 Tax=Psilocybe cubensis TaxID=181762 RepID=A0ACB8HGP0_PSICU|nr:Glycine cleavage system H protein, mitochondrial [Psilocybe cubensis]KAH9486870.1 Glycine cleavage system H protein, mitochondrial [Psilocybe cubensis]
MQSALRTMLRAKVPMRPYRPSALPTSQAFRAGVMHSRNLHIKKYTEEHEVVNYDDATGVGIVSITDHAQSVLGDVVFVELPPVGTSFSQGDQLGAVESVKAASDIYAPVSGTVEEINEELSGQPGLLNKSPEDKGWLVKMKLSDPSELDKLMTFEEYKSTYED